MTDDNGPLSGVRVIRRLFHRQPPGESLEGYHRGAEGSAQDTEGDNGFPS